MRLALVTEEVEPALQMDLKSIRSPFVIAVIKDYNLYLQSLHELMLKVQKSPEPLDAEFCAVAAELAGATDEYIAAYQKIAGRVVAVERSKGKIFVAFADLEKCEVTKTEAVSLLIDEVRDELEHFAKLAGQIDRDRRTLARNISQRYVDVCNTVKRAKLAMTFWASDRHLIDLKHAEIMMAFKDRFKNFDPINQAGFDVWRVWNRMHDPANLPAFRLAIAGCKLRDKTAFDAVKNEGPAPAPVPVPPTTIIHSHLPRPQPTPIT